MEGGLYQHPSWAASSVPPTAPQPYVVNFTNLFKRDLKRAEKRGKDLAKLWRVVERLQLEQPLEPRHKQHPLHIWNRSRSWLRNCSRSHYWECHIESDWLLIWKQRGDALTPVRTGTHADLFG
ncbi:MAG: type II toxin-antitoxin system YafQ family toxin [Truepera sp.]|nr:type II toxin-antitoxin system YafQ family toxin [Truepera sp.]